MTLNPRHKPSASPFISVQTRMLDSVITQLSDLDDLSPSYA